MTGKRYSLGIAFGGGLFDSSPLMKIQLKSDNINPFGGLFSIFNQFDRSCLRLVIDEHPGRRGAAA